MSRNGIAVLDVETTGLSPWRNDRLVEIAIVELSSEGEVLAEYDTLVNPERDLGPTQIHRIAAGDVLRAPTFDKIAGDVLEILARAGAVAGHNISFDKNFLIKEYDRLGVSIPDFPAICTCNIFGRASLQSCCQDLGVAFQGEPHRALTDARATAQIISYLYAEDPELLYQNRLDGILWPAVPARKTPCFQREQAREAKLAPPGFLQRIAEKIHHNVGTEPPNVLAYSALIDRILEDRAIDRKEEDILVDAALNWKLSPSQLNSVHSQYLYNLAVAALADGVVTDSERRDLRQVARLLGQDLSELETHIESALSQLAMAQGPSRNATGNTPSGLHGQRVCFTGQLQSSLDGELISRELAEALAAQAGLIPASTVTKKLDLLVVADPNTQSGKATKARKYGIRILSEAVFWKMIGIQTG